GGGQVELLVAEEHLRRAQYLLYRLQTRDEDDDTAAVDELNTTAITREKLPALPVDELPGASEAIQATPLTKRTADPPPEMRLTTTPARSDLVDDRDRAIPDLSLPKSPREFTWLIVLEVLFWAAVLLAAAANGCFQ